MVWCLSKLGKKFQRLGNPSLSVSTNLFTMFCFFVLGISFLIYFNAVINIGDLLATEFPTLGLDFMSTFPLFQTWFNFFFAFGLVLAAIYIKRFPYNLLIHLHFVAYFIVFIITPLLANYIENETVKFWVLIVVVMLGGAPCQLSGGVVTSLAGLFSSTHNTIYLIGASASGIIVSLLRILSGFIYAEDRTNDYYLSVWVNLILIAFGWCLYFILYYTVPYTRSIIAQVTGVIHVESEEKMECEMTSQNDEEGDEEKKSIEEDISLVKQVARVMTKTWVQLLTCVLDYFITFCVFSGIFYKIPFDEELMELSLSQQITTFCYMGGDFIARILALIRIKWNKWVLLVLSLSRFLFYIIFFIYYCNVYTHPILLFVAMFFFSVTHGWFASAAIGLCFASSLPQDMKMTANLCNLALDLGLSLGATGLFILNLTLPTYS